MWNDLILYMCVYIICMYNCEELICRWQWKGNSITSHASGVQKEAVFWAYQTMQHLMEFYIVSIISLSCSRRKAATPTFPDLLPWTKATKLQKTPKLLHQIMMIKKKNLLMSSSLCINIHISSLWTVLDILYNFLFGACSTHTSVFGFFIVFDCFIC